MNVLVTGFGPFPGVRVNPTTALMQRLSRQLTRPGTRIATHVFETRYDTVDIDLPKLLARHKPDALIMFGIAARTPHLRIETCAHNAQSMIFADAGGETSLSGLAVRGAERKLPGRAPFAQLLVAAQRARVPARLSRDAGRYLCNYVYAQALTAAAPPPVIVFVHVPKLRASGRPRARAKRPGVTLDDLVRAAEAMLVLLPGMVRRSSG